MTEKPAEKLEQELTRVVFYGADWCPDCRRAADFLRARGVEFRKVDVELDRDAAGIVQKINGGKRIIPTIVINGTAHTNPSNDELASLLGINRRSRVLVLGADWCPDCLRAKKYLREQGVNFMALDVDQDETARAVLERVNRGRHVIPTVIAAGKAWTNPDNPTLRRVLELDEREKRRVFDVVIAGGGAAGLTAAIYLQRDRYESVILERRVIGGNASLTERIENYPGFQNISGPKLMEMMAVQAAGYGAEIETGVEVRTVRRHGAGFTVETNMGVYEGRAVILAVGSDYRRLNIPGETELLGAGVHFCATCDGPFYRGMDVIVIGGGNSALEEGMYLARFCRKVTIVSRDKTFTAAKTYAEKLSAFANVEAVMNRKSVAFRANRKGAFEALVTVDNESGETFEIRGDGVFVFIGMTPNTGFLAGTVELDERGYVVTTGLNEASVPGIFAAGDCRRGAIAQVASATGEGVVASYGARDFLGRSGG